MLKLPVDNPCSISRVLPPTVAALAMEPCHCDPASGCCLSLVKPVHYEVGGGYRAAVARARAVVQQSNAGERIEHLVYMLRYSQEQIADPARVVHAFMGLSGGGSEKMERAMRILFADAWVAREAQGRHAIWPIIYRARREWQKMHLSGKEYSRWMNALSKAALFYWAAGEEGYCCIADACDLSI